MIIFVFALGAWLVAIPFGLLKPSAAIDEEFIVRRKR
jgi:hypothetical protein